MEDTNIKVQEELFKQLEEDLLDPELIQDNKIPFEVDGKIYRVRMPSQRELFQAKQKTKAYKVTLLKSDNVIFKRDLIRLLKDKQNIDVLDLQAQMQKLKSTILEAYITLAARKDSEVKSIQTLKTQLIDLRTKHNTLIMEVAEHLCTCIEVQVEDYHMIYLTSLCTEKYVETRTNDISVGNWISVWDSYEQFEDDSTRVALQSLGYLTELLMHVRG